MVQNIPNKSGSELIDNLDGFKRNKSELTPIVREKGTAHPKTIPHDPDAEDRHLDRL